MVLYRLGSDEELEPEDGDDDFDKDDFFYCAMDRTGSCGKAGSEECEFQCPYRADQREQEKRKANRIATTRDRRLSNGVE